eukprot:728670-Pleurochrysis_carterae.AAC.2
MAFSAVKLRELLFFATFRKVMSKTKLYVYETAVNRTVMCSATPGRHCPDPRRNTTLATKSRWRA